MTQIDSRTSTADPTVSIYVTSESQQSDWAQPPASHYVFLNMGDSLIGKPFSEAYVPSRDPDLLWPDLGLRAELADWEAAGAEAWTNFDKLLG